MKRKSVWILLCAALLIGSGCGNATNLPMGDVRVNQVSSPILACVPSPVDISGLNFQSEHGLMATVVFTAVTGTPFENGTASSTAVPGTIISNTQIQCMSPVAVSSTDVTITVILPGGAFGSSAPGSARMEGGGTGAVVALNDDYTGAIGNVPFPSGFSVLNNDSEEGCVPPEKGDDSTSEDTASSSGGLTIMSFDTTTANGGVVEMTPDGMFTYCSAPGFEGGDTFTYVATNGSTQDTATVSVFVNEVVWFIDDDAPPGGNGKMTDPFNTLDAFLLIQGGGGPNDAEEFDYIFFYEGNYFGNLPLLNDQTLVGQGVDLVVANQTIVTATQNAILSDLKLQVTAGKGEEAVIILANRTDVLGVSVHGAIGFGIVGESVSGPITIDQIQVFDTGLDGIFIFDASGQFTLGNSPGTIGFQVGGCGNDGIFFRRVNRISRRVSHGNASSEFVVN